MRSLICPTTGPSTIRRWPVNDSVRKSDTPGMFSEIAPRYDLLNHVLSLNVDRLWRRDLVRAAGLPVDGRVLDACTGTADVAIGFARRLTDGYVVGVDRSVTIFSKL